MLRGMRDLTLEETTELEKVMKKTKFEDLKC